MLGGGNNQTSNNQNNQSLEDTSQASTELDDDIPF